MEALFLLLIPLVPALIAMPIVKRAPVQGAFLAAWISMTFLGFAPSGLMGSTIFLGQGNPGGLLVVAVSISGVVASVMMVIRLSRLYRGEALGSARYLVLHHAAVVFAFFIAELISGEGFYMTVFCLVPCGVGALIVAYDEAKLPYAQVPQPIAF